MSLISPTAQEEGAFARLAMSTDGQKLIGFLDRLQKARDKENRTSESPFLERGQGRSLQIDDFILLLDKSTPSVY